LNDFVIINEVGLRDGLQNQPRLINTEQKLQLADKLIAAGIKHIEATSFVNPNAVPQMADAGAVVAGLPQNSELNYSVLVPNMKGYQRAVASGMKNIGLVIAVSDTFNQKNIRMTLDTAREMCFEVLNQAKQDGNTIRVYLSTACFCPYEGEIRVDQVHQLASQMINHGATEISIADTTGSGVPNQIDAICRPLVEQFKDVMFNLHDHDTAGQATAMVWAGYLAGIRSFDASIGGLGGCPFSPGASGNVATEDLVYLFEKSKIDTGISLAGLSSAVSYAEEITGQKLGGKAMHWYWSQQKRLNLVK
jgi:hydroxymethylglutaryl-CoA lyase